MINQTIPITIESYSTICQSSQSNLHSPILLYPDIHHATQKKMRLCLWMSTKIIRRQDQDEITGKINHQSKQAVLA